MTVTQSWYSVYENKYRKHDKIKLLKAPKTEWNIAYFYENRYVAEEYLNIYYNNSLLRSKIKYETCCSFKLLPLEVSTAPL